MNDTPSKPKRIAMWSGPRNLSTAMMYSFGARDDCAIWDEPYYAAYLRTSGLIHPMQQEILDAWPHHANDIADRCIHHSPVGKQVFYQKHMTQHMLPEFDPSWMKEVTNVFLIRHPARVIASYHAKKESPTLEDIGFRQQAELLDLVQSWGQTPIVIDSSDIRANPKIILQKLCNTLGIAFQTSMLSWPKGGNSADGPWAPHWYNAVWNSTGFAGAEGPLPEVVENLQQTCDQAMLYYQSMSAHRL